MSNNVSYVAGENAASYEKARKYNLFSFANAPHKDYKPFFVDHAAGIYVYDGAEKVSAIRGKYRILWKQNSGSSRSRRFNCSSRAECR